jgi:hypothetical protein
VGRCLWREYGSVIYNCCWPSPAQSFSGQSPVRLLIIFYCLRFETSLFVASSDSQGMVEVFDPASTRDLHLAVWISDWTNFMRTEQRTPSRTVDSSVILCCHETWDNHRATRWFIQAYSLPRKCVSTNRCLATDVSAVIFWLHTSAIHASCHNTFLICQSKIIRSLLFTLSCPLLRHELKKTAFVCHWVAVVDWHIIMRVFEGKDACVDVVGMRVYEDW